MRTKQVNVTELRQNLPQYLAKVAEGESFQITVNGRVVARLEADVEESQRAKARIASYRAHSVVGDVLSPVELDWNHDVDHL